MNKRAWALLAALTATIIYGINHTVAKEAMPDYISAYGFIMLRLGIGTILFWIASFFAPRQKIEKKDWGRIVLCALLGMAINMLAFFRGLQLSTPINSSVLMTITPIIIALLSAFIIGEKITLNKGIGIFLGFIGAVSLVLYGAEIRQDAPNIPLGNVCLLINATAYGVYLIVVKKLTEKYHPLALMKWLFLIGFIITLPVTFQEFLAARWQVMPFNIYGVLVFVVFGSTFMTYMLNVFALQKLKASTLGVFTYVQPLVGVLFAILSGRDQLTMVKTLSMLLIFLGVYLAGKKVRSK